MDRKDVRSLVSALEKGVAERKSQIAMLEREIGRLEAALEVLEGTDSGRIEVLGSVAARSDSDFSKFYIVSAHQIDGWGIVFTCDCPAFRFTTGDMWKGERAWCKHIQRSDRYALLHHADSMGLLR